MAAYVFLCPEKLYLAIQLARYDFQSCLIYLRNKNLGISEWNHFN
jgi:hypothetical protein